MSKTNFVAVGLHEGSLETAREMLNGFPKKVMRSGVYAGISRARRTLETESSREIVKEYDITQKNVRAERTVRYSARYSPELGLAAKVSFSGTQIPLYRFARSTPRVHTQDIITNRVYANLGKYGRGWFELKQSIPSRGHSKRGTRVEPLNHVFTATMKAGKQGATHTGFFERTGKYNSNGIEKIKEISALAVPQMLNNEDVRKELTSKTIDAFDKRLSENVNAILNGYWKDSKRGKK